MTRGSSLSLGPDRDGKVLRADSGSITWFGPEGSGKPPSDLHLDCSVGRIEPGRINVDGAGMDG